ncbi:MAG: DUF4838 domain-containing protein [Bacteroidota bacterium]
MKIPHLVALVFTIFSCIPPLFAGGQYLHITEHGKSSYVIIIPSKANDIEKQSAELLQVYVERISGCRLAISNDQVKPIRTEIVIGFTSRQRTKNNASPAVSMDPDGFHIKTDHQKLLIAGGSHKGTYYGVVDLLEKQLGCRIYAPEVEFAPKNETILLQPLNYSDKPANRLRIVHGQFNENKVYKEWMRLDNINEVFADGYYVHTFNRLVPRDTYFDSHPEYFAFMNGKRITDQLCMSNPEVLRLVIEKLTEEMSKQPEKKVWSVSQNDNFSYCQCDKCKAIIAEEGAPSGPLLRFVNQVAARFPDKTISTLAYQFSRAAPKVTKPASNVQIMLCTIELNRSKSIESDSSSRSFVKDISDWGKLTSNIYLWDYTVDFANSVTPFPNLHVLQPNIQFLSRNGASQHFQQTNTMKGNEMAELKAYLLARLLWNPDVNLDSVKNVFLNGYYAESAPFMHQYIDRLETELIKSGEWLDIYGSPVHHEKSFLSAVNMDYYNNLFDQALAAVAYSPELVQRVKVSSLPVEFATMEIGKNDMFGPRGWYSEENGKFILKPGMKALLDDFNTTSKTNGVKYLNESGLTVDSYYTATLRFIDVQVDNNLAFRKAVSASPLPSPKYSHGDMVVITNGVQGADSYKVHWLGWEGTDFQLTLDLGENRTFHSISLGSLWDPKSWILHPSRVTCMVSADGITWDPAGSSEVKGSQQKEDVTRNYIFTGNFNDKRFIRYYISATKKLPSWHPSAGGLSWVFLDEIVVK